MPIDREIIEVDLTSDANTEIAEMQERMDDGGF